MFVYLHNLTSTIVLYVCMGIAYPHDRCYAIVGHFRHVYGHILNIHKSVLISVWDIGIKKPTLLG